MYQAEVIERPPYGLLNVRAQRKDCDRLERPLGLTLPCSPNTTVGNDGLTAFWLGPDEWLIRTEDGEETSLAAEMRARARGRHVAITVVSDAYVVYRVQGRDSREVLCQGTGIDLHPSVFPPGRCVRTVYGKSTVILHYSGDGCYEIYAWRSYARYLGEYLRASIGV